MAGHIDSDRISPAKIFNVQTKIALSSSSHRHFPFHCTSPDHHHAPPPHDFPFSCRRQPQSPPKLIWIATTIVDTAEHHSINLSPPPPHCSPPCASPPFHHPRTTFTIDAATPYNFSNHHYSFVVTITSTTPIHIPCNPHGTHTLSDQQLIEEGEEVIAGAEEAKSQR